MNIQKQSNLFFLLLILLCCLIAYWPLTFNLYSLKNDALNYFLPVRFLISESIQNGHLPFWSPYFNLGYPLHGDMQSGVWNPFVQLFSLFGTYTIKMLQYETLLYVYISGIGMYFLLQHFITEKQICLFGAISYMLCGYNTDSAQFLNWISSASFIPFIFLFYYQVIIEKKFSSALLCSVFLYLMFVTAYPAHFILTCYVLLALFAVEFFKSIYNKKSVKLLLKHNMALSLCFIILSLPAIISYAEFLPLTERGSGASFEEAMSNSFHPLLLFSYLTPLAVWKAVGVGITDPLERNSYFGLITFAFFIVSYFLKSQNYLVRISKIAFFIFLLFSFGIYGGLRIVAYYSLPLMDAFRHPASAKIFTIFFACILAAFALKTLYLNPKHTKACRLTGLILIILFFLIALLILKTPLTIFSLNFTNSYRSVSLQLKSILSSITFSDLIFLNICIQIPFLILLLLYFKQKIKLNLLIIGSIINSILHIMLFQPFTVVKKDTVKSIQSILDVIKADTYLLPDLQTTLQQNSINGNKYFKEIGVTNLYDKKIGRVEYRITPSNLLSQNSFWHNQKLRSQLMSYPIVYRADTIINIKDYNYDHIITDKLILLSDSSHYLNSYTSKYSLSPELKIFFTKFTPNRFELKVINPRPGYFCLLQNYYPRWKIYINGEEKYPDKVNVTFMGFKLPQGTHHVTFKYYSTDLIIAFLLSHILLFAIIIWQISKASLFKNHKH